MPKLTQRPVAVAASGVAGGLAYFSSKGAVIGLTHSLAKALGPKGIRANVVNPGVVQTATTMAGSCQSQGD